MNIASLKYKSNENSPRVFESSNLRLSEGSGTHTPKKKIRYGNENDKFSENSLSLKNKIKKDNSFKI
jgi:hypothetical protein